MLPLPSDLRKNLIFALFVTCAAVALGMALLKVWHVAVPFDDAYISFRYADNLARGRGLVYNPGERVEGYTNFLWVLLLAGGIRLGFDPLDVSLLLGRAAFVASAVLCAAIVWRASRSTWSDVLGLAPLAWLLLPADFASFAGSGLETTFFAAQLVAFAFVEHRSSPEVPAPQERFAWLHSLLPTSIVLTRPDGVIFVATSLLITTAARLRSEWPNGPRAALVVTGRLTLRSYGPFALAMIAFASFKLAYYGSIVPNTYYAKRAYAPLWDSGLSYIDSFADSYPHVLVLTVLCIVAVAIPPHPRLRLAALFAGLSCVAFTVYVAKAGGDFMHYRFAFEIYPLMSALAGLGVLSLTRISVPAAVAAASLVFLVGPGQAKMEEKFGMQDIEVMHNYARDGARVGPILRAKTPPNTILSAHLAGTVAYFSDRTTIDQWGLNDAYVAHLPSTSKTRGHMKDAPLEYLRQRGVNLQVGHPWILSCSAKDRQASKNKRQPHSPLVYVRLDERECLRTEYVVQTPELTDWFCGHPEDFILDGVKCH